MLPTRIAMAPGEALDSYLERVARANDLLTQDLFRILTEAHESECSTAAFMMTKPDGALIDRVARLTGLTSNAILRATLTRYDHGRPLNLDGLNPREHETFRKVVSRGWFPAHGTQACPECLFDSGVWQLSWRLPFSAVCLQHGTHLVGRCAGCGVRFRSRRHNPFRPVLGDDQPCGNPLGGFEYCGHSVVTEVATTASDGALRAGRRIADAVEGAGTNVLDGVRTPTEYLTELKNLTTLLLHLASQPHERHIADWAQAVQHEAIARACELRGPRWGIRPPEDAVVRGLALAEADWVLSQSDPDAAVRRLSEWFDLIPNTRGGPRGWLVNRTVMSPLLSWLVIQVLSARRHIGLQLDHQDVPSPLPLPAIPQLLDEQTYRRHFAGMLATQEGTGRLYASLCLARARKPGSSWSAAAKYIGLDPDIGRRTARAASSRLLVAPPVLAEAVNVASTEMPRHKNYRLLERRVANLARVPEAWFRAWCMTTKPQRRPVALPYAITWMWCEIAQGSLDTSPAWPPPVTRQSKAAYRVFRDTIPREASQQLRVLARGGR